MADIYVDPTSPTNGAGTQADPRNIWPTGIGAFDTINLLGGTRLTVSAQLSLGGGSNNIVRGYYPAGNAPLPIITSTASNQSLITVNRPGVTEFNGIHFDQCLNMAANGGVIGTALNGGRHANLAIKNCKFTAIGQNAILLNGTNTTDAPTDYVCIGNIFDDIGADCTFGAALRYEFAYNRCTRMSSRTVNGDGVGFINADPEFVWVHHNYIDHSAYDYKQCIIIDCTTNGSGVALIEDNVLIQYGSPTESPVRNTVIISDCVTTVRRNVIYAYGLAVGTNYAGDRITDNLFLVGNVGPSNQTVTMTGGNNIVANNTFVALNSLAASHRALALTSGLTSTTRIANNAFAGFPTAIDASTSTPLVQRNAYFNCGVRRFGASVTESGELVTDLGLDANYRPNASSPLLRAGLYLGPSVSSSTDLSGRHRGGTPSVGAFEFPA